jgi:hypothetical protein
MIFSGFFFLLSFTRLSATIFLIEQSSIARVVYYTDQESQPYIRLLWIMTIMSRHFLKKQRIYTHV